MRRLEIFDSLSTGISGNGRIEPMGIARGCAGRRIYMNSISLLGCAEELTEGSGNLPNCKIIPIGGMI